MGRMSREKGKRGEREAADAWEKVTGWPTRRGAQFSGSPDSPDLITECTDIHLEVKRCESGSMYAWMDQALGDCGLRCPVVLHKKNHRDWLVVVRLQDVVRMSRAVLAQTKAMQKGAENEPGNS